MGRIRETEDRWRAARGLCSEQDGGKQRTATPKPSIKAPRHWSRQRRWRSASFSVGAVMQRLKQMECMRSLNCCCACIWIDACASATACCSCRLSMAGCASPEGLCEPEEKKKKTLITFFLHRTLLQLCAPAQHCAPADAPSTPHCTQIRAGRNADVRPLRPAGAG